MGSGPDGGDTFAEVTFHDRRADRLKLLLKRKLELTGRRLAAALG